MRKHRRVVGRRAWHQEAAYIVGEGRAGVRKPKPAVTVLHLRDGSTRVNLPYEALPKEWSWAASIYKKRL